MWHHKLSSMPRWVSFSNAPSLISLNSLSYSCLHYDTSVFFPSFCSSLLQNCWLIGKCMCTSFKQLWSAANSLKLFEDENQLVTASAVIQSSLSPSLSSTSHPAWKVCTFPDPLGFGGGIRLAAEGSVPSRLPARPSGTLGPPGLGRDHSLRKVAKVS